MRVGFWDYLKKNRGALLGAFLFSCACFFVIFTKQAVMIDEEFHMTGAADPTLFLYGSRYTNYLLGRLFFNSRIIPFWTDFFALILWNVSALIFGFIFFEEEHSLFTRFVSLAYFSTVPFCVGEMFAFSEIILEIACAYVFTALAVLLTLRHDECRCYNFSDPDYFKWVLCKLGALVLMVFAIGSYQAFICVYLTAVAAFSLRKALKGGKWFAPALESFAVVALAAFLYSRINHMIQTHIGSTTYLSDNYVGWKSDGILKAGFMALANVVRVSFSIPVMGERIYGGIPICVLTILFIVFAVREVIITKDIKRKAAVAFLSVILIMAPFSLYIALGTYRTHGRVLQALSLVGMTEILFISKRITGLRVRRVIAALFSVLLLLNLVNMNVIYGSAYKAYERDCNTADAMIEYIKGHTDPSDKALVFVGALPEYDDIRPKNVTLGASFFSWDGGANHRLRAFFELRGLKCLEPGVSEMEAAVELVKGMKPYGTPGESILIKDDLIVIYLSEPKEEWFATNLVR